MLPLFGAISVFFQFKFEPQFSLLTAVRTGLWTLETVLAYEIALRTELTKLKSGGGSTAFVIDIRSTGPQPQVVADALRAMVAGLGELHADRTAVVTSSGLTKLRARRVADHNAQVFTSMVLARDWVKESREASVALMPIHSLASDAEEEGPSVHVHGPGGTDLLFTPKAAIETAKHIEAAAIEVLMEVGAHSRRASVAGSRP